MPHCSTKTGIRGTGTPETEEITRIGTLKSYQRQLIGKLNKQCKSISFKTFQITFSLFMVFQNDV